MEILGFVYEITKKINGYELVSRKSQSLHFEQNTGILSRSLAKLSLSHLLALIFQIKLVILFPLLF